MDKIAQKRRLRNKLREMVNAPTEKLMGVYSPQFIELMEQLREVDDSIREQAAELKNLLKLAKTNFNRREYMTAITYLGQFHDKLEAIDNELSKLGSAVDIKHHEFLFGDVDQEHIDYLTNQLSPKLEKRRLSLQEKLKAKESLLPGSKKRASLEKEAGLADWWSNLTTDRGRALAAWEKRFPKESKELKRQTENIIKDSSSLLDFLVTVFKVLASLRSTRSLEEYLKTADKLKQKYRVYDATFAIFYDTYVKKFVEMQKQLATKPTTDTELPASMPSGSAPATIQTPPPEMDLGSMPPTGQQAPTPEALQQPMPEGPRGFPVPFHARDPKDIPEHVKAWMKQQEEAKQKEQSVLAFAPTQHSPTGHVSLAPSSPTTLQDQEIELSHVPDTDEKTMVSPTLGLSHRDKPIQVSVEHPQPAAVPTPQTRKSHEAFLQQLNKLADASPFIMAAELIKYANSIKDEEPDTSEQLLQLSKNILAEGS